ncbi:MAG: WD40 repeat domain-containing protein [Gemmataceae bacterium]
MLRLWDTTKGNEILPISAHRDAIRSVAYTPDGQTLISHAADGSIRVWDVATRKARHVIDASRLAAFSPDGKILASFEGEKPGIRWWNTTTGQLIPALISASHPGYGVHGHGRRRGSSCEPSPKGNRRPA